MDIGATRLISDYELYKNQKFIACERQQNMRGTQATGLVAILLIATQVSDNLNFQFEVWLRNSN